MASFDVAYRFMLANEDKTPPLYAEVPDAPPGAHAISGINSAKWPEQYKIIANIPQGNPDRATLVEAFYRQYFWENAPNGGSWYSQLTSDEVAKRVFDASVNMGSVAAVRCLQEAANLLAALTVCAQVAEDGRWGPATVATANDSTVTSLVAIFQDRRVAYYDALIAKHPSLAIYKAGWTARALK